MDMAYGTREHEDYLLRLEAEDDAWGYQPDPATSPLYGGCGCYVSMVLGGDCAHTLAGELDAEADVAEAGRLAGEYGDTTDQEVADDDDLPF